ncbi:MAG: hypothetical protein K0S93_190 [Nitrososphaeraceae archaeon]|jgi:hypothetical protein|nr:hypothetical protein [Nitrososphaeraceae archaeon]
MRKNSKTINDEYYQSKGYKNEDLNIRGKPKRGLASFQCEEKLWHEFDKTVEKEHGKYKKSYIIESLIREYMAVKKSGCYNNSVKLADRLSDRSLRD